MFQFFVCPGSARLQIQHHAPLDDTQTIIRSGRFGNRRKKINTPIIHIPFTENSISSSRWLLRHIAALYDHPDPKCPKRVKKNHHAHQSTEMDKKHLPILLRTALISAASTVQKKQQICYAQK